MPERVVGKGVGLLKRVITLILVCAGILSLGALAPPFIRLLYEFSKYAYAHVGQMFH
jgi:hypothetical protein